MPYCACLVLARLQRPMVARACMGLLCRERQRDGWFSETVGVSAAWWRRSVQLSFSVARVAERARWWCLGTPPRFYRGEARIAGHPMVSCVPARHPRALPFRSRWVRVVLGAIHRTQFGAAQHRFSTVRHEKHLLIAWVKASLLKAACWASCTVEPVHSYALNSVRTLPPPTRPDKVITGDHNKWDLRYTQKPTRYIFTYFY